MLARILYAAVALTVLGTLSSVRPGRGAAAGATAEGRPAHDRATAPSIGPDAPRFVPQARRPLAR
jgi:hypothetical protein